MAGVCVVGPLGGLLGHGVASTIGGATSGRDNKIHTRPLFSYLSLLKSFFSFVYGGTCTRLYLWWHLDTFGCMDVWMYGCMDVWCYSHSFCVFGAFSRTMLALASLLLSCHTSVCLGALLNATHTPHNAGPRAMSRNTRQAMLDGIDRKRKRGYKVTCKLYLR